MLGFNGAGKSTIYKMLTGQTKMSAGKAVLYEYEFTKDQEMVSNIMFKKENAFHILIFLNLFLYDLCSVIINVFRLTIKINIKKETRSRWLKKSFIFKLFIF